MSKQTAVEWLVEQMIDKLGIRIENTTEGCELFEQAKAMERDQIRESYIAGFSERDDVNKRLYFNPLAITYNERIFKEWYNKTYGGDK
jgi:hypothetical protein